MIRREDNSKTMVRKHKRYTMFKKLGISFSVILGTYRGDIAARVIEMNIRLIQDKEIHLNSLVENLFARGILSQQDKNMITDTRSGQLTNERMSRLLDIVAVTIKGDGNVFGDLLEIFEQEGAARGKTLSNKLKTKYHEGKINKIVTLNNLFQNVQTVRIDR